MHKNSPDRRSTSRRRFLRSAAGISLGLPLLDAFTRPGRAAAAAPAKPVFAAIVVEMNGVQQGDATGQNEPERFWPASLGPLTEASMTADADRATSSLSAYASKLLMVRNIRLPFGTDGCAHSSSGNQLLTAAKYGPAGAKSLAFGESVDNYIGRAVGTEPLNLYAGSKGGYIDDHISFRGSKDVRVGEGDPWIAYQKIVGMNNGSAAAAAAIAAGRKSVNDFLRAEIGDLRARTNLSMDDRRRLDLHFQAIRDIEVKVTTNLPDTVTADMKSVDGQHRTDAARLKVVELQYDLMAFALASGYTQIVVLQSGDGTDGMQYVIDGVTLPRFHPLSHRATSDSTIGNSPMAAQMVIWHHQIDIIRLNLFKHLLDNMAMYTTPEGSLLDVGFALWTNSVATGYHRQTNIPFIIAGGARGYFKSGQHLTAAGGPITDTASKCVANNQMLNTLIGAFGIQKPTGAPVDDFGDPSLPKGVLPLLTS